jgi:hypothetical protein
VSRSSFFALGAAIAGLALLGPEVASRTSGLTPGAWLATSAQPSEAEQEAVLVFLVNEPSVVRALAAGVDRSRVVARSEDALALREGRIVAAGPEAASRLLAEAGWTNRPIELVTPASVRAPWWRGAGEPAPDGEEGALDIAELASKPTLTLPEALAALRAME